MRFLTKRSRTVKESSWEYKRRLARLAKSGPGALFTLAPVLPPALLKKAIKIARAAEDYRQRDRLLKLLKFYLARRSKRPATLDRDLRFPPSTLRTPTRTLSQMLAPLSAPARFAALEKVIISLERAQTKARGGDRSTSGKSARDYSIGRDWITEKPSQTSHSAREKLRGSGHADAGSSGRDARSRRSFDGSKGYGPAHDRSEAFSRESDHEVRELATGPSALRSGHRKPLASEKRTTKRRTTTRRVVSTGFAPEAQAAKPIRSNMALQAGKRYFFWLQVGSRVRGSIEVKDEILPTQNLPQQAILDVVLFEVENGLKLVAGQDTGRLKLESDGSVTVKSQPWSTQPTGLLNNSRLLKRRLFFPVITPEKTGTFRLRCNIYYEQVLVQSRIVRCRVMRHPRATKKALQAIVDYTLSRTLGVSHVTTMRPHLLSVMLNSSGNGTHDFFFYGAENFNKEHISFDGLKLKELIDQARNAYALAAWGSNNPWQNQIYLYADTQAQNVAQLKKDLTRFAIRGYNIYDTIANQLAGGSTNASALAELMRKPGRIQIALRESPSFILPAAIVYDYPLDVDANEFALCSAFLEALKAKSPLEESVCFKGDCPTREVDTVVCPSGFWGYRHELGIPLSVGTGPDAPTTIEWKGKPVLTVAVSTDPGFVLREQHLQRVRALKPSGLEWNYGATRDDVISKLKSTKPQLVYFYCHGGVAETRPYLQVGEPGPSGNLSPSFVRAKKIRWEKPRPLVFINGCHTTALEPERAIEFISPLIENANAAGVIGTEITIFEPLATVFAEECLQRFLNDAPIGEAIRGARLKLLKSANPLGLVYIPYAIADLHLVEQKNGV